MYNAKQEGFVATPTPGSLTSTVSPLFSYIAQQGLALRRLAFYISTAIVSTGPVVLSFYLRPTPGSSSGQTLIGTLTIPAGAAAGNVYYKEVEAVIFRAGDQLGVDVTTASAGGSAAGAGYPVREQIEESPEEAINWSNHILGT